MHNEMRLRARKGKRSLLIRQIKCKWKDLYGLLEATGGRATFREIPTVNQELI
jgi:hypothetical protein